MGHEWAMLVKALDYQLKKKQLEIDEKEWVK